MAGDAVPHGGPGRLALGRLVTRSRGRSLLGIMALGALYYGAARVGYAFEFAGPVAAIVWLPVGVAIAFLYVGGLSLWPGLVVGDLLANDYGALPFGVALSQTAGNVLECVLAAALLRLWLRRASPLGSVRGVSAMVAAVAIGTATSASIGALSLLVGGVIDSDAVPRVWRTWWLGDLSGALVVVPLALAWRGPLPFARLRARAREAALLLVVLV